MLRTVVIAAEGIRAAGHQTAHFAARQRVAVGIRHPHFIVRAHRTALGIDDPLRAIVKAGVIHQPLRHAEHLLQLAADFRRNARGEGR